MRATLKPTRRWPTQYRGHDGDDGRAFLDDRVRVQGGWGPRFTFTHWLKPDLALALTFGDRTFTYGGVRTVQLGAQYYPPVRGRVRPHFGAAIGRFDVQGDGFDEYTFNGAVLTTPHHAPGVGFGLGAGVDVYIGRRFSVSLDSQGSFAGEATDISTWVSLGWTFGGR